MSDSDRERWDRRYGEGEYEGRTHPTPLLEEWVGRFPRGRALDVACGIGRNATFLASKGYTVDAMDISQIALDRGQARAEREGVAVNWIQCDFDSVDIARERYDLIVVARFLDRALIPRLIDGLRDGGYVFYDHHIITHADVCGPSSRRFRARPNELLDRFRDLRVLYYREGIIADPDAREMALAQMIACKGDPGF